MIDVDFFIWDTIYVYDARADKLSVDWLIDWLIIVLFSFFVTVYASMSENNFRFTSFSFFFKVYNLIHLLVCKCLLACEADISATSISYSALNLVRWEDKSQPKNRNIKLKM